MMFMHPPGLNDDGKGVGLVVAMVLDVGMWRLVTFCRSYLIFV